MYVYINAVIMWNRKKGYCTLMHAVLQTDKLYHDQDKSDASSVIHSISVQIQDKMVHDTS